MRLGAEPTTAAKAYTFKLLRNLTSERVKCHQDDQEVTRDAIRGPSRQLLPKPVNWLLRRCLSMK